MFPVRSGLILALAGCTTSSFSSGPVEVIDLDQVLDIWERVTRTPIEGVTAEAEPGAELDAGVRDLVDPLEITIDRPMGGVALKGFDLEYLEEGAADVSPDKALEERLKALGYAE